MSIQVAKELLKKGIQLNDQELIELANILLDKEKSNDIIEAVEPAKPKRKRGRPRKKQEVKVTTPPKSGKDFLDQFKVDRKESKNKTIRYEPVRGGKNTWVDDGSDDETSKLPDKAVTPTVKLTPRQRTKPKKVTVICGQDEEGKKREDEGCGAKVEVFPQYAREYFLCDECLEHKAKRG